MGKYSISNTLLMELNLKYKKAYDKCGILHDILPW